MEYKIVSCKADVKSDGIEYEDGEFNQCESFDDLVNQEIKAGYFPLGGVAVATRMNVPTGEAFEIYYQAMTKDT